MIDWKKGMKVFVKRYGYGPIQTVDYNQKYTIRSIGKKQAILDRIYTESKRQRYSYGRKGQTFFLSSQIQISQWRTTHPGEPIPSYYFEFWSDYFIPAGNENWDAEENYF